MPRGLGLGVSPIPNEQRAMMLQCFLQDWSAEETHDFVFVKQDSTISLGRVKRKFTDFGRDSLAAIDEYATGEAIHKRGRKSLLSQGVGIFMREMYLIDPFRTLADVRDCIQQADPDVVAPGIAALKRVKVREKLTMKKVTLINRHKDVDMQLQFMRDMSVYPATSIVDFDETSCGRTKFEQLYGCAPSDKRILKPQWEIGGQLCSVIAVYSMHGFLAWRIFYSTINHHCVNLFLEEDLKPVLTGMDDGVCVICDGASVHKAESTKAVLERVSHGHWCISAPYSPELKPVEKGFSLVLARIRRQHAQRFQRRVTEQECTDVIEEAFRYYSIFGEGCESCLGHWDLYVKNHQDFMDTI